MTGIREHPSWRAALAELLSARVILLLGATDTGKTTLLTWLANALAALGRRVAIVDADVGQSSIGPPTTIGLGVVAQPITSVQEVVPCSVFFVGSTSPRGHLLPVVVGTRRLMDRALALGVEHVLIDTCGFIAGQGGRALKHYQIDLLAPDAIVCLQHADECEALLTAYRRRRRPRVLRLRASPACRRRSAEERRGFRERALRRYFATSTPLTLSWDDLDLLATPLWYGIPVESGGDDRLRPPGGPEILWMERAGHDVLIVTREPLGPGDLAEIERAMGRRVQAWSVAELHGTLLGLFDDAAAVVGLGILRRIDFANHRLDILAAGDGRAIVGIQWSQTRVGFLLEPPLERERSPAV